MIAGTIPSLLQRLTFHRVMGKESPTCDININTVNMTKVHYDAQIPASKNAHAMLLVSAHRLGVQRDLPYYLQFIHVSRGLTKVLGRKVSSLHSVALIFSLQQTPHPSPLFILTRFNVQPPEELSDSEQETYVMEVVIPVQLR